MSAPFACNDCARPMFERRQPQLCASCEERRERDELSKYPRVSCDLRGCGHHEDYDA